MPRLGDGQIFERYLIIRALGNGVAGESYEAEDRVLQRKVTLKLIHPWATLADSARRQFFREMQGISTLNHPYLATVLDYGEGEGHMYVARRYVSSGSLLGSNGRLWFQPPLPIASASKYAHQLAQTLHYIHQHGYVHGALTFANVLVLRGPNVEQEADYAPFLLADSGLTHFTRRFGSPQIEALPVSAAPEQIHKRATPASDQFALAVLLYFWLSGRPPYLGSSDEVEQLKLTEKITPLSTLNPGVTTEQDSIILRALTADPEDRYPSVLAFTEALLASLAAPTYTQSTTPISLSSEQPETPRDILTRPLPALRKMPTLKPASEPSENGQNGSSNHSQANMALTSDQLSAPDLLRNLPETPLPAENTAPPELAQAPQDAPQSSTQTTPIVEEVAPAQPATTQEMYVEIPAQASTPAEPVAQPNLLMVDEATGPLTSEQVSETPASTPPDNETATFTSDAASELGSVETAQNGTDQPTYQDVLVPRLLISSPYANSSSEFLLTSEATNVGRASANDLLLDDDNLTSRYHALFKRVESHVLVFDKHSNNGVFVNGQRIETEHDYELTDGDHISIGSYELIYRAAQAKHVARLI